MDNKAMNNELKETIEDFVMSLESYTPVVGDITKIIYNMKINI